MMMKLMQMKMMMAVDVLVGVSLSPEAVDDGGYWISASLAGIQHTQPLPAGRCHGDVDDDDDDDDERGSRLGLVVMTVHSR